MMAKIPDNKNCVFFLYLDLDNKSFFSLVQKLSFQSISTEWRYIM